MNGLSKTFQHVTSANQFVQTWKKDIKPYLDSVSGIYKPPTTSGGNSSQETPVPSGISTLSPDNHYQPSAKKRRVESQVSTSISLETSIDDIVAKKYIGEILLWQRMDQIGLYNLRELIFGI